MDYEIEFIEDPEAPEDDHFAIQCLRCPWHGMVAAIEREFLGDQLLEHLQDCDPKASDSKPSSSAGNEGRDDNA